MMLQQIFFLVVGAVIMMVICPALMLVLTIALDSIKLRLAFDLAKYTSPVLDIVFIPALFIGRALDIPLSGFKAKSEKEQEAYWQEEYNKAGY
ncbi:MAG: hypothetical protein ED859_13090 [Desulfuromonadales bacterium]|nr:MAG: hypothetical protein ED859_13090 [Desulfuromonadales bacterium]